MRKTIAGLFLGVAALTLAGPAVADSMRCGTKLMTDGDPSAKVEAYCGPPVGIERREIVRSYSYHRGLPVRGSFEVSVEFWTYNFGPHKLMYRLRFEDGLLVDVETLGHGFHAPGAGN
jgi:hypothetical protein